MEGGGGEGGGVCVIDQDKWLSLLWVLSQKIIELTIVIGPQN